MKIKTDVFTEMIDKTIFSVSNDETKFNLTGIYIKSEEENNNIIF